MTAKLMQLSTRRPLTCTVQAPHWPWSQPFLVPGRSRSSRSASSKAVRGSMCSSRSWPFTFRVRGTVPGGGAGVPAASGRAFAAVWAACSAGGAAAATPAAPSPERKERRLRREAGSPGLVPETGLPGAVSLGSFGMHLPFGLMTLAYGGHDLISRDGKRDGSEEDRCLAG